jgi:hypothetical protein
VAIVDYVRGRTLQQELLRSKVQPFKAAVWFLRLVEALKVLHTKGSVHEAISPFCIVIEPEGRAIPPVLTQLLTPPLGSFCSPERLRGGFPTPVDDVWSLHATLYAAVTGTAPFEGDSRQSLLERMSRGPPRKLDTFGLDEPDLQRILDSGLEVDRRRRVTDLAALRRTLDGFERGEHLDPRANSEDVPRPSSERISADNLALLPDDGIVFDPDLVLRIALAEELPEDASSENRMAVGAVPNQPLPMPGSSETASSAEVSRPPAQSPFAKKHLVWPFAAASLVAIGVAAASFFMGSDDSKGVVLDVPAGRTAKSTSAKKVAAPPSAHSLDACVASYFAEGTFLTIPSFRFLCDDTDLTRGANRLYTLVRSHERPEQQPAPSPATSAGSAVATTDGGFVVQVRKNPPLGWYELAAAAIVRTGCCKRALPAKLPRTDGDCPQLQDAVQSLADESTRPTDLSPYARKFDETVACLFATKTKHTYHYRGAPSHEQRTAFQHFLTHAAVSDAQRSGPGR